MAKPAARRAAPLTPESPDGEAFLEIDASELDAARRDPVVRQFAKDADAALRDAERRGELKRQD